MNGARLIEELAVVEGSSGASLRKILAALAGEPCEHLPGHLVEDRGYLEAWRDRIYAEAEASGQL